MSIRDVSGVLLAGDHPWWESPLGVAIARPLLPVVQSPVISHVLCWLRDGGVRSATICANSSSKHVRRHFGNGNQLDLRLTYYDDLSPRGPAGCVRDASMHGTARLLVVAESTLVPKLDLADLLAMHIRKRAAVTVVVHSQVDSGGGRDQLSMPIGVYVFDRRVLDQIPETGYQDIKETLIPRLHERGERVVTYVAAETSPRVTDHLTYLALNEWLLGTITVGAFLNAGYRQVDGSFVHRTACVDPSVRLIGTTVVGPLTHVAQGAIVVGPTTIGGYCAIGEDAVVCRSVIWDRGVIASGARLDQCVMVNRARVGEQANLCGTVVYPAELTPITYTGEIALRPSLQERDQTHGGTDEAAHAASGRSPVADRPQRSDGVPVVSGSTRLL